MIITGRRLFSLFHPLIFICNIFLKIIPTPICYFFWSLTNFLPGILGVGFRYVIAKRLFKEVGENVYFGNYVVIKNVDKIVLLNNISIHEFCYLDGIGGIKIGDNVSIAHGSSLLSFEHTWGDHSKPIKYNPILENGISIDNDVWIGCGVRVLSGCNIKSRTIIAAGAVLKTDTEKRSIYAGVPAKKIKSI